MSDRAKKKERKRLKRQQKQKSLRKAAGASPFKRIAAGSELVACNVNSDWRERGQAAVFVLRRSGGSLAMASFFIDLWCCGLKDCWGRFDITREEYDEMIERSGESMDGDPMPEVELTEAVGIVAGGVRFAIQNGFRLPAHYQRWLNFLGVSPRDCSDADLTPFGFERGKLHYVGPVDDLRRRLIGCDLETFMARPDVYVTLGGLPAEQAWFDEEEDEADEEDEENEAFDDDDEAEDSEVLLKRAIQETSRRLLDGVRRWCYARQVAAHAELEAAVPLIMGASLGAALAPQVGQTIPSPEQLIVAALEHVPPHQRNQVEAGMRQVVEFIQQAKNSDEFLNPMGFGEVEGLDDVR